MKKWASMTIQYLLVIDIIILFYMNSPRNVGANKSYYDRSYPNRSKVSLKMLLGWAELDRSHKHLLTAPKAPSWVWRASSWLRHQQLVCIIHLANLHLTKTQTYSDKLSFQIIIWSISYPWTSGNDNHALCKEHATQTWSDDTYRRRIFIYHEW